MFTRILCLQLSVILLLLDRDTVYDVTRNCGSMRTQLLFSCYDGNFKGFLDRQDWCEMTDDIFIMTGKFFGTMCIFFIELSFH